MKLPSILVLFAAFALARALPAAPDAEAAALADSADSDDALAIRAADADANAGTVHCTAIIFTGKNWKGLTHTFRFEIKHKNHVVCSMGLFFPFRCSHICHIGWIY